MSFSSDISRITKKFEGDIEQLEDHQKVGKHEMCKGVEDKFDNELYLKRLKI